MRKLVLRDTKGLDRCFITIKNYLDFFPDMYDIQVILNH